ncbi:hypothetical protein [Sedimentisphaera salicampi]|uniref:hypothetical protein n=1 Tax=Sedimentisphaera salicampi TaxID=1941349 RepID=UPI000A26F6CB|nr:hypothetical protein [Sedimentisphaera salicampi]
MQLRSETANLSTGKEKNKKIIEKIMPVRTGLPKNSPSLKPRNKPVTVKVTAVITLKNFQPQHKYKTPIVIYTIRGIMASVAVNAQNSSGLRLFEAESKNEYIFSCILFFL